MLKLFDRVFDGRELDVLGCSPQLIQANWKLMFENIMVEDSLTQA
jgi:salicylate 5-hydroxylase large subunit